MTRESLDALLRVKLPRLMPSTRSMCYISWYYTITCRVLRCSINSPTFDAITCYLRCLHERCTNHVYLLPWFFLQIPSANVPQMFIPPNHVSVYANVNHLIASYSATVVRYILSISVKLCNLVWLYILLKRFNKVAYKMRVTPLKQRCDYFSCIFNLNWVSSASSTRLP